MSKKAIVTQVTRNPKGDYINKHGKQMFCWNIMFNNQDAGETHSMSADKCRFVQNQEHQYEIEPIMSKNNPDEVWKYRIKYVDPPENRTGGYKPRELSPEQQKSIACQVAYEVAIDFAIARGESKVKDNMANFTNWLVNKGLTGDVQKRACGCLRIAVRMMQIEQFENWDSAMLLKAADEIFNTSNPDNFKQ
jgi:hypothetical protein